MSDCFLLARPGAGVLAHDEITEDDSEFDPLEEVRVDIEGKN